MIVSKKIKTTVFFEVPDLFDITKAINPQIKAIAAGINAKLESGNKANKTARTAEIIPKIINSFLISLIF
ncbi:hypothetical protein GCM10022271_20100 [Corallibacter vietnamensis]|uniref:Uncharacterized protein n=1 Tax=Corallibacter vietnamensis TaxID=904130 RepID=A0ABP7H7Z0_9FLAO